MSATDIILTLICAGDDRILVEGDKDWLETFGLECVMTELGGRSTVADWGRDMVGLVYLSRRLEVERLEAHLRSSGYTGQSLIAVVLDEEGASATTQLSFSRVLLRDRSSEHHFTSVLGAAVLEELDRVGFGESSVGHYEETRLLPDSLTVSCDGKSHTIPRDFRGLVSVGRSHTCQIAVASTFASRLHGCFRSDGADYHYRDMSRNGTLVYDGHEELLVHDAELVLPPTAELRIGDVFLKATRNG